VVENRRLIHTFLTVSYRKTVKNTIKSQCKQRYVHGKVKVKFAQSGRNRIALLFFKHGSESGRAVMTTPRTLYSGNDREHTVQEVWWANYSQRLVSVRSIATAQCGIDLLTQLQKLLKNGHTSTFWCPRKDRSLLTKISRCFSNCASYLNQA
jgi:hypothetical protein